MFFEFIQGQLFGGIVTNALYDGGKDAWQKYFGKDLLTLYLDAFDQSVQDLQQELSKHSDGGAVSIDRQKLEKLLRANISNKNQIGAVSQLSNQIFVQKYARGLREHNILIIPGHNLSDESIEQHLRNLINQTTLNLYASIREDENAFREVMLAEAQGNQQKLEEIKNHIESNYREIAQYYQRMDGKLDTVTQNQSGMMENQAEIIELLNELRSLQGNSSNQNSSNVQIKDIELFELKLNRLDDTELERFCLKRFPKVSNKFSSGMRRDQKVNLLLDHCRRKGLLEKLETYLQDVD
jgi:hypothetical protein